MVSRCRRTLEMKISAWFMQLDSTLDTPFTRVLVWGYIILKLRCNSHYNSSLKFDWTLSLSETSKNESRRCILFMCDTPERKIQPVLPTKSHSKIYQLKNELIAMKNGDPLLRSRVKFIGNGNPVTIIENFMRNYRVEHDGIKIIRAKYFGDSKICWS